MTDSLPEPPLLDPAALAGTSFSRGRKGYDPAEVNSVMGRAADALRIWELRDRQLQAKLEMLESKLTESQELDEGRIASVLGEETARIITAAREAAGEIRTKAEEDAARLLKETDEAATARAKTLEGEAAELRDEARNLREKAAEEAERLLAEAAESSASTVEMAEKRRDELLESGQARHDELIAAAAAILAEKTAEAEASAAALIEEGSAKLAEASREAEAAVQAAAAEAESMREAARVEGRKMVAEAKEVRERILADLADRRRIARQQIEAARVGRDTIIELLRTAGADLTGVVDGLLEADAKAQSAAEGAAAELEDDTDTFLSDLDAELGIDHFELIEPEPPVTVEAADIVKSTELVESTEIVDAAEVEVVEVEVVAAEDAKAEDSDDDRSADDRTADDPPVASQPANVIDIFAGAVTVPGSEELPEGPPDEDGAEAPEGREEVSDSDVDIETEFDDTEDDDTEDEIDITSGSETSPDTNGATVHDLFARIRAEGIEGGVAESTTGGSEDQISEQASSEPEPAGAVALDDLGAVLDRRDGLLVPIEKQLLRSLRRLASDEQNETLDRLRRVKRGRPEVSAVLADTDESTSRFTGVLLEDFAQAVEAGSTFWAQLAGTSADTLFKEDDRVHDRLEAIVSEFIAVHRAHLERAFADAEEAGLDTAELGDSLSAAYRDWRSNSLSELAGDLATAGFAHGERTAAGPGTPWRWVVDNGGLPCADGEDNALAGAVPCEDPFPTGDITPPAHAGCRCILVPAHQ